MINSSQASPGSDEPLYEALATIRARGAIGERSLPDAVLHADQFVGLIPEDTVNVVDLGSGGGLPALVIAWRRPHLQVVMIERRATRADMLERAVRSLGMGERCTVLSEDARVVARRLGGAFDVATARSFAAPSVLAPIAAALLRPGGVLLVSEPPSERSDADRWPKSLVDRVGLRDHGQIGGIRSLHRLDA